jgi:perosamine synthetase
VDGGTPVRRTKLPYGHQDIREEDIAAVVDVLRSDWLTTGPGVSGFEEAVAKFTGSRHAVAVNSGTAALHAAAFALNLGPGDEVVTTPMTFCSTANSVVFQGARPVFADVDADTLLIDPAAVERKISRHTRAIFAVDYAGQPCDYDALQAIADRHGLALLDDACHAIGGAYRDRPVGSLGRLNTFSFHPVKHITTGEGGMVTTDDPELARRARMFRTHGIDSDPRKRETGGQWYYEMVELGYNYRVSDFACALGRSQLARLPEMVRRRQEIARRYDEAFAATDLLEPLGTRDEVRHAYHLYVVRLNLGALTAGRGEIFRALHAEGIGVNVHYIPVHLHPFYRDRFGTRPGDCPVAEAAYERMFSLPIWSGMTDQDVDDVIAAVGKVLAACAR